MKRAILALVFLAGLWAPTTIDAQEFSPRDQLRIAVQGICPISGESLADAPQPVKVRIGTQEMFIHCRGCLGGEVQRAHWATIHSNFARAQQSCLVLDRALPSDPRWTIVEGQIVYVCCPRCIEAVERQPEQYLEALDVQYAAYLQQRRSNR